MSTLGGGGGSRYKNHHYSQNTQISAYLNPVEGHRGAMEKKGIQPRDHLRDNRHALKELQSAMRLKKAQGSEPPPPMWKMEKFSKVPSKVALVIHQKKPSTSSSSPTTTSPSHPEVDHDDHHLVLPPPTGEAPTTPGGSSKREFLRKGTLTRRVSEKALLAHRQRASSPLLVDDVSHPPTARGASTPTSASPGYPTTTSPRGCTADSLTPRKPAVPKATDLARLAPKSSRNHIVENRRTAIQTHPPTKQEERGPYRHKNFGQVPQYLQERKQKWEMEEERIRAAQPDPNCPPGMRLLTDEERQETLHALAESEAEIRRQLVRIPLQVDTPSMMRRREELERRLGEIAKDKMLFCKPKVFIRADG